MKTCRLVSVVLSVQLFFTCHSLWAMSCEFVFPGKSAETNGNVISFDFGRRDQAPAAVAPEATPQALGELLEFKPRKPPENLQGDESPAELASLFIEQVSRFEEFVRLSAQNRDRMTPTQSNVWNTHRQYLELPRYLDFLSDPRAGLSPEAIARAQQRFSDLARTIEETNFFGHYEQQGFSLVPKVHEKIKEPLPAEILAERHKLTRNFKSNLSLEGLVTEGVLPPVYAKNAEGFIVRAERYLKELNQFLSATKSAFDSKTTDLDPLNPLLNELDGLFQDPRFAQAWQTAQNTKNQKMVEIIRSLEIEMNRFRVLSFSLNHPRNQGLRLVD